MQQSSPGTPRQQFRAMNILCSALMIGVLIFSTIILALVAWNGGGFRQDPDINRYFVIAATAIAAICLFVAMTGYKKRLSRISALTNLNEKLENYRASLITYFAACEGAALFSVITLFLTGDYRVMLITAIMLLAMFSKRPRIQQLTNDLQLNFEEQQLLSEP